MNKLHLGFSNNFKNDFDEFRKSGFLLITDDPPPIPKARLFDLTRHGFNPLKGMNEKRARELSDALYTLTPGGENTLRVKYGRIAFQDAFMISPSLDRLKTKDEDALIVMKDILFNPTVRNVLCSTERTQFDFRMKPVVIVRLHRKELGDKDALILAFFLIAQWPGQIIIEDFGFYGRDAHISLIRENRLIAGVNYLNELPPRLRRAMFSIEDVELRNTLYEDAVEMVRFAHDAAGNPLLPDTVGYSDFIKDATTSTGLVLPM